MSKSRAKKRPTKEPAKAALPSAGEQLAAARREIRQLRELRATMRQIERQCHARDVAAVNLARVLVATTEFVVLDERTLKQLEHSARESKEAAENYRLLLDEARRQLNQSPV